MRAHTGFVVALIVSILGFVLPRSSAAQDAGHEGPVPAEASVSVGDAGVRLAFSWSQDPGFPGGQAIEYSVIITRGDAYIEPFDGEDLNPRVGYWTSENFPSPYRDIYNHTSGSLAQVVSGLIRFCSYTNSPGTFVVASALYEAIRLAPDRDRQFAVGSFRADRFRAGETYWFVYRVRRIASGQAFGYAYIRHDLVDSTNCALTTGDACGTFLPWFCRRDPPPMWIQRVCVPTGPFAFPGPYFAFAPGNPAITSSLGTSCDDDDSDGWFRSFPTFDTDRGAWRELMHGTRTGDCNDTPASGSSSNPGMSEADRCSDGIDNDCNGYADCDDSACRERCIRPPRDAGSVDASFDAPSDSSTCAPGQALCGVTCVDVRSDPRNCGACGMICAVVQTCSSGICTCGPGETFCTGHCTDTASDSANCGSCGRTCPGGWSCASGTCQDPCSGVTCVACQTCSGGACVAVPSGTACSGGTCVSGVCAPTCVDNDGDGRGMGGGCLGADWNDNPDGCLAWTGAPERFDLVDNDGDGLVDNVGPVHLVRYFYDYTGSNLEHRFARSSPGSGWAPDAHWIDVIPVDVCTNPTYRPQNALGTPLCSGPDASGVVSFGAPCWSGRRYAFVQLMECRNLSSSWTMYVTRDSTEYRSPGPGWSCSATPLGYVATDPSTAADGRYQQLRRHDCGAWTTTMFSTDPLEGTGFCTNDASWYAVRAN